MAGISVVFEWLAETEGVEEEEDKKPAAVQGVEPNEVAQLGQEEGDSLLLEDILLAQEERNG